MDESGKGILGNPEADGEEIRRAMESAIYDALRDHKGAGNPIAVWDWQESRVVIVPPGEIAIPAEAERDGNAD